MVDSRESLERLAHRLDGLRADLVAAAADERLAAVHPGNRASAENLLHYLALRRHDVRELQTDLAALGLSSLGRAESHVLATVDAVRRAVASLAGLPVPPDEPGAVDFDAGSRLLEDHADALFGEPRSGRRTRIMATVDAEAATDGAVVHDLLVGGAEVVRISCAHGDASTWAATIDHLRESEAVLGLTVHVAMDLGGPRPRTGPIDPGPRAHLGDRGPQEGILVRPGDEVRLVRDLGPADPSVRVPRIACTPAVVVDAARVGHRVYFEGGMVTAVVEAVSDHALDLWITEAAPDGVVVRPGTRVNLPDTDLDLPALTEHDEAVLPFLVRHADIIGLSFVRTRGDVVRLQARLRDLEAADPGLLLKVETPAAFANLPDILLTAMASPSVGVMIARGDLALEAGYVRLGEVQEEILWVCEAAHVPVVWATDVLDTLARTGRPSRAEVTDAASSGRAECVMVNAGPYAAHAVGFLDDLLGRMAEHQRKKSSLLRRLHAWDRPETPSSA